MWTVLPVIVPAASDHGDAVPANMDGVAVLVPPPRPTMATPSPAMLTLLLFHPSTTVRWLSPCGRGQLVCTKTSPQIIFQRRVLLLLAVLYIFCIVICIP